MSALTVYKQYVTCQNTVTLENYVHEYWSPSIPTSCPADNPDHLLLFAYKADNISSDVTYTKDITTGTTGNFKLKGYTLPVSASTGLQRISTINFPYVVRIIDAKIIGNTANHGDTFNSEIVFPIGMFGTITSGVSSGSVIQVGSEFLARAKIGFMISLTEGGTTEYIGEVITINTTSAQVTVSGSVTNTFTNSASIVCGNKFVEDVKLVDGQLYEVGGCINASMTIPVGSDIVFDYVNIDGLSKEISFLLQIFI
jgi:hypothetical protein